MGNMGLGGNMGMGSTKSGKGGPGGFLKLKRNATVVRRAVDVVDESVVWVEYQAATGPFFYAKEDQEDQEGALGQGGQWGQWGQWLRPSVFDMDVDLEVGSTSVISVEPVDFSTYSLDQALINGLSRPHEPHEPMRNDILRGSPLAHGAMPRIVSESLLTLRDNETYETMRDNERPVEVPYEPYETTTTPGGLDIRIRDIRTLLPIKPTCYTLYYLLNPIIIHYTY
jgi:hypothetical protein